GTFQTKAFQIGSQSGEAVMLTMKDMRSDNEMMGGNSYVAQANPGGDTDKNWKDWRAADGSNELTITITDKDGNTLAPISIEAKEGDDIEELATYINGQTDAVQASVNEDGQLQVFASNKDGVETVAFGGTLATDLGMSGPSEVTINSIDVTTVGGAQEAVAVVDAALKYVDSHRAELGAFQNRFGHAINNLDNINENVNASKSRIKDTDFAKETTALTKAQILGQASSSVLAQAKQAPNAALSLLG
ncbi:flagellin, partial [Vibrio cincinnatiensis]|uniref:flagellin n=1 Tax=Vibrio cincinnatiensis TaxID=675 RepID=UPI0022AAABB5